MPDALLLACRFALSALFAAAAGAKLARPERTREAASALLGGSMQRVPAVALAVPAAELAVAGLLLPERTALVGAAAGTFLLLVFSAAVGRALARGWAVECGCFGGIRAARASCSTLARNALLVAPAALVLAAGPGETSVAAAGIAAAAAAAIAAGAWWLARRDPQSASPPGPSLEEAAFPSAPAPGFTLPSADGEPVSLDDLLLPGKPLLLVFTRAPSEELLGRIERWERYDSHAMTVCLVAAERPSARPERLLLDPSGEVGEAYGARDAACAVLVALDGTLASPVVCGSEEIDALAARALAGEVGLSPQWADGLEPGAPLPALALPTLHGGRVALRELVRGDTVFLFWRTGCRPCRNLYEEVRRWERARPPDAPSLVVVSQGGARETAAERFRSAVLLDPELEASTAFGAEWAPAAVRVNGDGRIASQLAVSPEAIVALLRA